MLKHTMLIQDIKTNCKQYKAAGQLSPGTDFRGGPQQAAQF
jgi:hypothetical protein